MEVLSRSVFVHKLKSDLKRAKLIAIIGNGGSLASAIHASADLMKWGFPVIDINNTAMITATTNDYSFKESYAKFFENYGLVNQNDEDKYLLIIMTVHGGKTLANRGVWSDNLCYAADQAKKHGWTVVTISGDHGFITELSDYYLLLHEDDVEAEQVKVMHEVSRT